MDLYRASLAILLENQAPSGAYVASPTFSTYHYCWFRDGAFCAHALDLSGEHASARRFHAWGVQTINARLDIIERALAKSARGAALAPADILHTRYTVNGEDSSDQEWPNFQLDGFGTWLWAVEQHLALNQSALPLVWSSALERVAAYLAALWRQPCYDCWEEFPGAIHPHTLAAIYAGLGAATRLGCGNWRTAQAAIREYLDQQAVYSGYLVKSIGSYTVDASLLGLALPYGVYPLEDPRLAATVTRIERSLVNGGGVKRYPTDTYYGGGEWVLLAAWLGWYYAGSGERLRAEELLAWIEAQADTDGNLPEQVAANLNDPNYLQPWEERWGASARPLLWSHAMYLILRHALA